MSSVAFLLMFHVLQTPTINKDCLCLSVLDVFLVPCILNSGVTRGTSHSTVFADTPSQLSVLSDIFLPVHVFFCFSELFLDVAFLY